MAETRQIKLYCDNNATMCCKNITVLNLFPTPIKIVENNSFDCSNLVSYCKKLSKNVERGGKNWITKSVFNTFYTYNICNDSKFTVLNNWINKEVDTFVKEIGFSGVDGSKTEGWFNLYNKNNYQEWHNHNFHLVSAIYYLKANKNSAKTYFKNPLLENPNKPVFDSNNPYTWQSYFIEPKDNKLVLFKSDLNHCVESHESNSTRITLAYNFSLKSSTPVHMYGKKNKNKKKNYSRKSV